MTATVVVEFDRGEGERSIAFAVTPETVEAQVMAVTDLLPADIVGEPRWRAVPGERLRDA